MAHLRAHMRAINHSTLTCFFSSPLLDLQKLVKKLMKDLRTCLSIPGSVHWTLMLPQGGSPTILIGPEWINMCRKVSRSFGLTDFHLNRYS